MQCARRGGDLRKSAGLLHADVPAGLRLQRQDLPKRVRRAARQGPDRLYRTLQEAAVTAGIKDQQIGKRPAAVKRSSCVERALSLLTRLSGVIAPRRAFPAERCFQVIYFISNIFFVSRAKPARTPTVETARLTHAVKNAWASRHFKVSVEI
jgi:hypothetical protein